MEHLATIPEAQGAGPAGERGTVVENADSLADDDSETSDRAGYAERTFCSMCLIFGGLMAAMMLAMMLV